MEDANHNQAENVEESMKELSRQVEAFDSSGKVKGPHYDPNLWGSSPELVAQVNLISSVTESLLAMLTSLASRKLEGESLLKDSCIPGNIIPRLEQFKAEPEITGKLPRVWPSRKKSEKQDSSEERARSSINQAAAGAIHVAGEFKSPTTAERLDAERTAVLLTTAQPSTEISFTSPDISIDADMSLVGSPDKKHRDELIEDGFVFFNGQIDPSKPGYFSRVVEEYIEPRTASMGLQGFVKRSLRTIRRRPTKSRPKEWWLSKNQGQQDLWKPRRECTSLVETVLRDLNIDKATGKRYKITSVARFLDKLVESGISVQDILELGKESKGTLIQRVKEIAALTSA